MCVKVEKLCNYLEGNFAMLNVFFSGGLIISQSGEDESSFEIALSLD